MCACSTHRGRVHPVKLLPGPFEESSNGLQRAGGSQKVWAQCVRAAVPYWFNPFWVCVFVPFTCMCLAFSSTRSKCHPSIHTSLNIMSFQLLLHEQARYCSHLLTNTAVYLLVCVCACACVFSTCCFEFICLFVFVQGVLHACLNAMFLLISTCTKFSSTEPQRRFKVLAFDWAFTLDAG